MILGEFLQWMALAPAGQRAEAGHALACAYLYSEEDAETKTAMEAALTVLLDDEAPEVRYALADALGASEIAPRHIIVSLAADHAEISAVVLSRSPLFIDAELVDIVAAASVILQEAVARRPVVSKIVAAAIAEVGEREACVALLANPEGAIARISFQRIAERFGEDPKVRQALFGREDLSPAVHQLLVRSLGDQLGAMLIEKSWLPEARARTVTREACDRATVAIAAESETEELPALVEHLRVTGQLTTALLLRAVCAGNVAFFETALGVLARVPLRRITSLVRAGRISALRAAYSRAGLPPVAFDAFVAALGVWRQVAANGGPEDRYRFTVQTVDAVLARYANISDGEMNELASMLRRFAADQTREAARDYARAAVAA
ncbi:MAG TPA: DUF2336 domain-containing protein [Bauldia sp.]